MLESIVAGILDTRILAMAFAAVGAIATVLTLAMPLIATDTLGKRMKSVAIEREKIRQRERERLARGEKVMLRPSPKQYMQKIVDRFNLNKWVGQEEARALLVQAGYRGQAPYITFLFFRLVMPAIMLLTSLFYVFVVIELDQPAIVKIGLCIAATYLGMHVPSLFVKNKITRRQLSIRRAFPDALDLLLICVESGMTIEAGFKKVSQEVGTQSIALAEELTLTTAELSFLPDRRQAYENLATRTNLEGVKSVCMALQQAERYGTPMAQTLRVMAQENRDMRMAEAEKKAAALPPQINSPDDSVLPSSSIHCHSRSGGDQGNQLERDELIVLVSFLAAELPACRAGLAASIHSAAPASAVGRRHWRLPRRTADRSGQCFQLQRNDPAGR
jgi:tight adherence protein C